MEVKKSPKADLEKNRLTYLLMGYVFILAVMLVGFEWSQKDLKEVDLTGAEELVVEEEMIQITRQAPPPPPPPPPPVPDIQEIEIVDNTKKVADVTIASSEDDQKKEQKIVFVAPPPVVEEAEDEQIFVIVEQNPQFKGGETALMKFLSSNIHYPPMALENGIQGRVICSFTVNRDGRITDAKIERGLDPALDREALRVINMMPPWEPGKQRGKTVRVKFMLPVMFKIQ